jgi:hypothetical protein
MKGASETARPSRLKSAPFQGWQLDPIGKCVSKCSWQPGTVQIVASRGPGSPHCLIECISYSLKALVGLPMRKSPTGLESRTNIPLLNFYIFIKILNQKLIKYGFCVLIILLILLTLTIKGKI